MKKTKRRETNLKKIPQRTCVGCNTAKDKNELIRIVRNKDGEINIDLKYKLDGRGTYICRDEECLNKAIKNKGLSRKLKTEIPESILDNIRNIINGGEIIG